MIENTNKHTPITHAFSSPISYQIYDSLSDLNQRLANGIRKEADTSTSDDKLRAHIGGYYSRGGFFSSEINGAKELATIAQQAIHQYLAQLVSPEYAKQVNFKLQTWVGLTRRGNFQTPHVHPGSNISGVYYVAVPEVKPPQGSIEFITPINAQEMSFLREISHSKVTINPQEGGLLLFPSYLRHYTIPFDSDEDRICIVFNVHINQKKRFVLEQE